jgi:hypothetical protein
MISPSCLPRKLYDNAVNSCICFCVPAAIIFLDERIRRDQRQRLANNCHAAINFTFRCPIPCDRPQPPLTILGFPFMLSV